MQARLTLKPGQKGTKSLVAEYGERLLYVRYRYDADARKRYKTVEIVVAETPWNPPNGIHPVPLCDQDEMPENIAGHPWSGNQSEQNVLPIQNVDQGSQKFPMDAIFGIKVDYSEKTFQEQIREEGGVWDRQDKLWRLSYEKVLKLGLSDRIVRRLDQKE